MHTSFHTPNGDLVSRFTGTTADGAPYSLHFVGGNRADAHQACRVHACLPIFLPSGRSVQLLLSGLPFRVGSHLRAMLPWLEQQHVALELKEALS